MESINTFDPVQFSREENEWLLEAVDKPPVVALQGLPPIVCRAAVVPVLNRLLELQQIEAHTGQKWVGVEAVKSAIRTFLKVDASWEAAHRRNPRIPRFPSFYSFDVKGRPTLGGPGSDNGTVRTYFDEKGNRVPFAISLLPNPEEPEWTIPTFTEQPASAGLVVNQELTRIECFCGHVEKFKAESRASYNAARARMSRHLRATKERQQEHLEVHTAEFRR